MIFCENVDGAFFTDNKYAPSVDVLKDNVHYANFIAHFSASHPRLVKKKKKTIKVTKEK